MWRIGLNAEIAFRCEFFFFFSPVELSEVTLLPCQQGKDNGKEAIAKILHDSLDGVLAWPDVSLMFRLFVYLFVSDCCFFFFLKKKPPQQILLRYDNNVPIIYQQQQHQQKDKRF